MIGITAFPRTLSRLLSLLAAAALLGGCGCSLAQIETVLAPAEIPEPQAAEMRQAATTPPAIFPSPPTLARDELPSGLSPSCDPLDPAHCLFPFPNDYFTAADARTDTGRRVRLALDAMPRNIAGRPIIPQAWSANDGFSPAAMLLTYLPDVDLGKSGAPNLENLERSTSGGSPVVLLDAETGERRRVWVETDAQAPPGQRVMILRPARGLEPGRRYIVALRRLKNNAGRDIEPSRAFRLYRDRIPTRISLIEERRVKMEDIFTLLAEHGVARRDLVLAWDFTVAGERNLTERLLHMRDDAFARLGRRAPEFEILCEEEQDELGLLKRVWGSYQVPSYLTGDGRPGERLVLGPDGLPRRTGDFTAYFSCIVPFTAQLRPARLVIYGHGLLNSLDEIVQDDIRDMAAEHNIAFCATNWTGMSLPDALDVVEFLTDASEFQEVADRIHQGILNTLFLGRLMIHPNGLASHDAFRRDGRPLLDTSFLAYDGNSQGGVLGGVATAVAQDWTRAVLGVPGMNFSLILRRSADFSTPRFDLFDLDIVPSFEEIFEHSYIDPLERPLVLALIQMLWDRAELSGYAHRLTDNPFPNTPPHKVLLQEAFGDQAMPNVATELLARTAGAHIRRPALPPRRDARPDPYVGLQDLSANDGFGAFDGSALVVWDTGGCPTPLRNLPPRKDNDPHGLIRKNKDVRLQKSEFLKPNGRLVDVCDGRPCMACENGECERVCSQVSVGD